MIRCSYRPWSLLPHIRLSPCMSASTSTFDVGADHCGCSTPRRDSRTSTSNRSTSSLLQHQQKYYASSSATSLEHSSPYCISAANVCCMFAVEDCPGLDRTTALSKCDTALIQSAHSLVRFADTSACTLDDNVSSKRLEVGESMFFSMGLTRYTLHSA